MTSTGFPSAAQAFYRDLEEDNSREFWLANKDRYDADVKAPLLAVAALLEEEFGKPKLFRPNRDVRFSADKSPYKTHQGVFVSVAPACGFYLEVNASEAIAVGGYYAAKPEALARVRAAIDDEATGSQLDDLLAGLLADGWLKTGDGVKTAPRGYSRQHPRIDLLRHTSLAAEREVVSESVEAFAAEVAAAWRRVTPLIDWCAVRLRD